MKIALLLLTALTVAVAGCQKHDGNSPSAQSPTVTYISTLGDITYQGAKLSTIGHYQLLYDDNQRLVGLRREDSVSSPSVNPADLDPLIAKTLIRYSFIWKDGKIAASNLDSMLSVEIRGGKVMSEDGMTDSPYSIYFYSGNRLDSILFLTYTDQNHPKKTIFEYGHDGNISKETSTFFPQVSYPSLPALKPVKTIATFRYDRHPNPWNRLVKQAGVILPIVLEGHNISKNNMIESDVAFIFPDDTINVQASKTYTYNSAGYPVEEITPGLKPDTIFYQYR